MTSLVDRYVFTALRRVPEQQRADIDRELRASIDDAVDAKVEAGKRRNDAIESTLLELGDPDRLADRYADRSNYLIGPESFGAWRRLMLALFSTVLPIVVAVTVLVQLFDDPSIGKVIGTMVTTVLTVGTHLAFWTTLVFAIIERTGHGRAKLSTTWSLQDLPKYEPRSMTRMELGAGLVWPVVLIAALVLQQFTFTDVPVLDPANWSFWWPFLILMFALDGVYQVWAYRLGTWTRTVTAVNAVLGVLAAAPMIWLLATDRFFNPAFPQLADLGSGSPKRWVTLAVIAAIALTSLWDILDVARRVERVRSGRPAKVAGTGNSYTFG